MVNYDKKSFVAGITVGRQLKGWATERINSNGEITAEMEVGGQTVIVLSADLALPASGFDTQTLTAFAYVSTGEIHVDLGTIAPPAAGFGAETIIFSIAETPPTREMSTTLASPELDGSIVASATLEVLH